MDGDSVLGCAEADSSGITGDLALSDVVGSLSTKEETITADDGVSSESGSLKRVMNFKFESIDKSCGDAP